MNIQLANFYVKALKEKISYLISIVNFLLQ
jgi:hypothetical protein